MHRLGKTSKKLRNEGNCLAVPNRFFFKKKLVVKASIITSTHSCALSCKPCLVHLQGLWLITRSRAGEREVRLKFRALPRFKTLNLQVPRPTL